MGNWTDRFDPETVDEIKRYEVGEGDFLLAERLAMHKGVESVFGFHVNCLGLGKPYWEKGVYLGDVLDFFDRHGETLIDKQIECISCDEKWKCRAWHSFLLR